MKIIVKSTEKPQDIVETRKYICYKEQHVSMVDDQVLLGSLMVDHIKFVLYNINYM